MDKIKRIIFDFDNTIMVWKDEYLSALQDTINDYNIECDFDDLNNAIGETSFYEFSRMTISNAVRQAKLLCDVEIDEAFVETWLTRIGERAIDIEDGLIDTLEYLRNKKYSLVVLSRFLGSVQKDRAEHADIGHYFEHFYGSDESQMKPHPNSYLTAAGPYKVEECVMIGDSLKEDVEGARAIGMKTIHFDRKGIYETTEDNTVIHKIYELKKIL